MSKLNEQLLKIIGWRPVRACSLPHIFSPVGAHLAAGVPLEKLGKRIFDPIRFELPEANIGEAAIRGQVLLLDNYGNLSTNIPLSEIKKHDLRKIRVRVAGREVMGVFPSFGFGDPGDLVAVFGTFGTLMIARVNGNAAELLGAGVGDAVEIHFD